MRIVSNSLRLSLLPVLAAVLCVGCTSFNKEWRQAMAKPSADPVAGCWKGGWQSQTNFHRGGLRCIIAPQDDDATAYEARFHATYRGVIPFEYVMPMQVTKLPDGTYAFTGKADLGTAAGGVYKYNGTIRDREFKSIYDSRHDDGTFFMTKQAHPE